MKKVLVVTYYWPPAGGPGVQRILKFVRYLPEYGWQPIVLTAKDGDYVARDESLVADIPEDLIVQKISGIEFYDIYRKITGRKKDETIPVAALVRDDNDTAMERFGKWVRINLTVPDARVAWIRPLSVAIREMIKTHQVDAILSTSPPHSMQVATWLARRKIKIPWLADLRDPWTEFVFYENARRNRLATKLDQYFEKKCFNNADALTTVGKDMAERFREVYPAIDCEVIYNGFDPEDMAVIPSDPAHNKFRIGHVGNLTTMHNPEMFWRVLGDLCRENQGFKKDLQLHFTGKVDPGAVQFMKQYGLEDKALYKGYVPHRVSVEMMKANSALLFVVPGLIDNIGVVPGKLFEYLASGTPLIAIGPPGGDSAEIIASVDGGGMAEQTDGEGIKRRILSLYEAWQSGTLSQLAPNPEKTSRFDRRVQTGQLANILDRITQV